MGSGESKMDTATKDGDLSHHHDVHDARHHHHHVSAPLEAKLGHALTIEEEEADENQVTVLHDLLAGGIAGSASVVVGHPFDTIKVRLQASSSTSIRSAISSGGVSGLFRGMAAPFSTAAMVNAIIFASYGGSNRLWDDFIGEEESIRKTWVCGSFAGFMQCFIIGPMEHVKCRLQLMQKSSAADHHNLKGPVEATREIVRSHGFRGLFRGYWATVWRETPAFGLYFTTYDYVKLRMQTYLDKLWQKNSDHLKRRKSRKNFDSDEKLHTSMWMASGIAGGVSGSLTWLVIYPIDVIKTAIQTMPLETPLAERRMVTVGMALARKYGWRYLFRGLGVTLVRAFPVNGIIFPVYEVSLEYIVSLSEE